MRDPEQDPPASPISGAGPARASAQAPYLPRIAVVVWARHYREGLLHVLRARQGYAIEDAAPGDEATMRHLLQEPPDVVLLDLPPVELTALVCRLHASNPSLKLIALNREGTEDELLALFEAGLTGFVPAEASSADIVEIVDAALRGEFHCPPRIATALIRRLSQSAPGRRTAGETALTPREHQILELAEQGLTNKGIGERLGISPATVKNHMHNALSKLSAHRRTEAIARLRSRMGA